MIAFLNPVNGVPQVWIKNLAQGDPIQITFGDVPAVQPRWSPKNDQIVFGRAGRGIWSVAPLGGPPRQMFRAGRNANFSGDGEWLVFERPHEIWMARSDGNGARRVDVKTRAEKHLAAVGPFLPSETFFDVSRSGQIVTAPFREGRTELWLADLKR